MVVIFSRVIKVKVYQCLRCSHELAWDQQLPLHLHPEHLSPNDAQSGAGLGVKRKQVRLHPWFKEKHSMIHSRPSLVLVDYFLYVSLCRRKHATFASIVSLVSYLFVHEKRCSCLCVWIQKENSSWLITC